MTKDTRSPLSEAYERISKCVEHREQSLDLSGLGLDTLPPEVFSLTWLMDLNLEGNFLTFIPSEIANFQELSGLSIISNRLTSIPPEIGELFALETLELDGNQLTSLPAEIGALQSLFHLWLSENQLTTLPPQIGRLTRLDVLDLSGNRLTALPPEIGMLVNLTEMHLNGNQLTALPPEMSLLSKLKYIELSENRLPASYEDALEQGIDSFRALLASLGERTEGLFEAKLLVTGEGKVGKSWALAALRGADPHNAVGNENTTWGIDRGELKLLHPDHAGEHITLNTWDFGGQEIYRVTHQFFSRRTPSIYWFGTRALAPDPAAFGSGCGRLRCGQEACWRTMIEHQGQVLV